MESSGRRNNDAKSKVSDGDVGSNGEDNVKII